MREVITLQLGQQSNYLATHFWNTQESYFTYGNEEESPVDHNIHFRPGIGVDGTETFTPRTVIYDLKGGFGSLRKINALYDLQEDGVPSGPWSGQTVVHREQPIEPSAYQASLDAGTAPAPLSTSTVRYWSDFNRVFFHPKSIVQLNEYELNSSIKPFEKWAMGEELFASLDKEHDILDRDLRPFVEEADQMQGVQIMAGLDDAWGGFAARYLERLRDEYGKTPLWVWGVQEPTLGNSREKRLLKLVNKARAITEMYAQASLLVPLALPSRPLPPSIAIDPSSQWHVSALFNVALESVSLYTRLNTSDRVNSTSLGHMGDLLNVFGKQTIATLQFSPIVPPRISVTDGANGGRIQLHSGRGELADRLNDLQNIEEPADEQADDEMASLAVDLSSIEEPIGHFAPQQHRRRAPHLFAQITASRAGNDEQATHKAEDEDDITATTTRTSSSLPNQRPKTQRYRSKLVFPLLDSFPRIFRDETGGVLSARPDNNNEDRPPRIKTALATDSSVTAKMRGLRGTVVRSIGLEDREQIGNDLAEIADGYQEGWDSGSDDDDD